MVGLVALNAKGDAKSSENEIFLCVSFQGFYSLCVSALVSLLKSAFGYVSVHFFRVPMENGGAISTALAGLP